MRVKYYFENLLVEEICLAYFKYLKNGDSSEEATHKTYKDYEDIFNEKSFLPWMIWLSLGYYQWELGRLIPEVKKSAKQSYRNILNRKDEFLSMDIYKNYLDRSYAPTTTNEQLLSQVKLIIQSLDEPVEPKKLRSQSMFKNLKKLLNRGVYVYSISCGTIHQQGQNCYIYFVIDFNQKSDMPEDTPIYIYNCYSVDNIFKFNTIENIPILETTYNKKSSNNSTIIGNIEHQFQLNSELISSEGDSVLFANTHKPKNVYEKIMYLGTTQSILLKLGEISIRQKNKRNTISIIRFEEMDNFLKGFLKAANKNYETCRNNQLIVDLDVSDYDWDDL